LLTIVFSLEVELLTLFFIEFVSICIVRIVWLFVGKNQAINPHSLSGG